MLYNLVFTESRHCVSQHCNNISIWSASMAIFIFKLDYNASLSSMLLVFVLHELITKLELIDFQIFISYSPHVDLLTITNSRNRSIFKIKMTLFYVAN